MNAVVHGLRFTFGMAGIFAYTMAQETSIPSQTPVIPRAEPVESSTPEVRPAEAAPEATSPNPPTSEPAPASSSTETLVETPPETKPEIKPPSEKKKKPAVNAPKRPPEPTAAEKNLFDYANLCYNQKAYDLASLQYQEYLRNYAKGAFAEVALYRLGESYLNQNLVAEAEGAYRELIKRYKSGDYPANSAYRLASLAYNRKDYKTAATYFEIAAQETTQLKIKHSAIYYKGRSYIEDNKPKGAYAEFKRLSAIREENIFWDRAVQQMARMDEAAERTNEALENFKLLSDAATDAEVRAEGTVKSGMMLNKLGRGEEAITYFQKAIEGGAKGGDWGSFARYGLVEHFYQAKDWAKVVEVYLDTEATQLPEALRPRMWLMVGNAMRQQKQWRRAADLYSLVDQYHPTTKEAAESAYRRLICLSELKDPSLPSSGEEAISRIQAQNAESEQIDLIRFLIAEYHFGRFDYKPAAAAYKKIRLEKIPENLHLPLLFRRGWSAQESGDNAGAIMALSQYIEKNPAADNLSEALAKRGLAYKSAQDWKNAQADFDQIISKFPDSAIVELAYEQSALIQGQRKDYQGMIDTFEKLLEYKPDTKAAPSAYFWTGQGYFEMKKYEDCISPLEKARQLDPAAYDKEASLKIMLAYFFLRDLENLTQAVEAERRKADGSNRVPRPIYQFLGLKYFELERMPQADQYLTFASTPSDPDKTDYRIWYTLSEARLQNNHFDGALFAAEQFLKKTDLSPSQRAKGMLNKATAYFQLNKYNEAKPLVNEALRLQPEARVQAYLRILLGDIAAAEGRFEEAAQSYVVPSQMFDDTEITPLALWKTIQALEKAGKANDAIGYKQDLEKRFPRFKPPAQGNKVPSTAGAREVVPASDETSEIDDETEGEMQNEEPSDQQSQSSTVQPQ